MKWKDLNEALAERSYKCPRRLGQPMAYPQCGADRSPWTRFLPTQAWSTPNARRPL